MNDAALPAPSDPTPVLLTHSIEIIWFLATLFRPALATKQFSGATKPFFAFGAELRKRRMVIKPTTRAAQTAATRDGRQSNQNPHLHLPLPSLPGSPPSLPSPTQH